MACCDPLATYENYCCHCCDPLIGGWTPAELNLHAWWPESNLVDAGGGLAGLTIDDATGNGNLITAPAAPEYVIWRNGKAALCNGNDNTAVYTRATFANGAISQPHTVVVVGQWATGDGFAFDGSTTRTIMRRRGGSGLMSLYAGTSYEDIAATTPPLGRPFIAIIEFNGASTGARVVAHKWGDQTGTVAVSPGTNGLDGFRYLGFGGSFPWERALSDCFVYEGLFDAATQQQIIDYYSAGWNIDPAASILPLEIDFTALPNQKFGTDAIVLVGEDGIPFRQQNPNASFEAEIVNGTGLICKSHASGEFQLGVRLSDLGLDASTISKWRVRVQYARTGGANAFSTYGAGIGDVAAGSIGSNEIGYMGFEGTTPNHVFAQYSPYGSLGTTTLQNSGTHIIETANGNTGPFKGYYVAGFNDAPGTMVGQMIAPSVNNSLFGACVWFNNVSASEYTIEKLRIEEYT